MSTSPLSHPDLDGRVALVTGASRGIGAAVALRLAAAGARVVLAARDTAALDALAARLPGEPVVLRSDLIEPDAPATLLEDAMAAAGRLDVLVNNAALGSNGPSDALDVAGLDAVLAVNVRAPLLLAGHGAALMARTGGGSIVSVSSVLSDVGAPGISAYAASKGAIDAMTRALAAEWGSRGVRVNAVRPGVTRTDMAAGMLGIPGFEEYYGTQTALGRVGEPAEVAEVVAFLAGDGAAYLTGQAITVDGGWGDTGAVLSPELLAGVSA